MTPFALKIRELRRRAGVTQKEMAAAIQVSPAYLSALEHGHRGVPAWDLQQRIIAYFNVIWDEADELIRLADVSNPRVVIDTSGLSPQATLLANRLSRSIAAMPDEKLAEMLDLVGEGGVSED